MIVQRELLNGFIEKSSVSSDCGKTGPKYLTSTVEQGGRHASNKAFHP